MVVMKSIPIRHANATYGDISYKGMNMKIYEFDFGKALAYSHRERLDALYVILVVAHKDNPIRFVVGSPESTSFFECMPSDFEPSIIATRMGEISYVGKTSIPPKFQCFKSEHAARDELVLFGENGNAIIKFIGLP